MKTKITFLLLLFLISLLSSQETLFEVKDDSGNVVFAVYPEGIKVLNTAGQEVMIANSDSVRFYIDDNTTQRLGRSAFSVKGTANRQTVNYFEIAPSGIRAKDSSGKNIMIAESDSIRFYINNEPETETRLGRSGFSVKGTANRNVQDYFVVNPDSSRIYVEGDNGGFSVENINADSTSKFVKMSPNNYFIGAFAGQNNEDGLRNIFIGKNAGFLPTSSVDNIFIGSASGYASSGGNSNVLIGTGAGSAMTSGEYNCLYGQQSGMIIGAGSRNAMYGSWSGKFNSGDFNSYVGASAGMGGGYFNTTTGDVNSYFGFETGKYHSGNENTFIGAHAGGGGADGSLNESGNGNTFVGFGSGRFNSGNYNVFIGYNAGINVQTGSNQLIVTNSGRSSSLLHGDFLNRRLVLNGNLDDNTLQSNFFVNGSSEGLSSWATRSDTQSMQNVKQISGAMDVIKQLKGIEYQTTSDKGSLSKEIGFIAEDVKEIVPEVVVEKDGDYAIKIANLNAILVEALKEQQQMIENLQNEISSLKKEVEAMK